MPVVHRYRDLGRPTASSLAARRLRQATFHSRATRRASHHRLFARQPGQSKILVITLGIAELSGGGILARDSTPKRLARLDLAIGIVHPAGCHRCPQMRPEPEHVLEVALPPQVGAAPGRRIGIEQGIRHFDPA